MKLILTIWTFYIMVLTSLPCSDRKNQCDEIIPKIEANQGHEHNQDIDDSCGPFCYCNCCSVNITAFNFKVFEVKQPRVVFVIEKVTLRNYALISTSYGNIWNPPKINI